MTTSRTNTCSNCRYWTANTPGIGQLASRAFGRAESDCEHPRIGELVYCISEAHTELPEKYPLLNIYRTRAEFGCRLFERK